jgi:hypothetical protein
MTETFPCADLRASSYGSIGERRILRAVHGGRGCAFDELVGVIILMQSVEQNQHKYAQQECAKSSRVTNDEVCIAIRKKCFFLIGLLPKGTFWDASNACCKATHGFSVHAKNKTSILFQNIFPETNDREIQQVDYYQRATRLTA